MNYEVIKALHIIAIISWMAGMLYLPRLFVYHATASKGSELSETLKVMERRLLRYIMTPSMLLSWFFGMWLSGLIGGFQMGWMQGKFVFVIILSALHGYFAYSVKKFAADQNTQSAKFWRIMNEVPTLAMIAIVFLVILKP